MRNLIFLGAGIGIGAALAVTGIAKLGRKLLQSAAADEFATSRLGQVMALLQAVQGMQPEEAQEETAAAAQ